MRTKRIQVPVSEELDKALTDYAKASKSSSAAVCASFLEEIVPVLAEMTKALNLAKQAPAAAVRSMSATVQKAVDEANQLNIEMNDSVKVDSKKAG